VRHLRTLRARTLLAIAVTIAALCAVSYAITSKALLSSAEAAEQQDTLRSVEIVREILRKEQEYFNQRWNDYSQWDDAQRFLRDRNEAFIESNLNDYTFKYYRANVAVLADTNGDIAFGLGFDLERGERSPVPGALKARLKIGDLLFGPGAPPLTTRAGLLALPEGPMMICAQTSANSRGEGPIAGTILWGRYLTDAEIQRLVAPVGMTVVARSVDDPRLPADFQRAEAALAGGAAAFVEPIDDEKIAGYLRLLDIDKRPALLVRVDNARQISRDAGETRRDLILLTLAVGLAFGAVILLLMERLALARLARLSAEVSAIGTDGDLARRIAMSGRDELSELTSSINRMLAALEENKREQEESQEALTRENERTEDARRRSDALLRNILPEPIIERLKGEPQTIAEQFDEATILFADIVNFTPLAERLSPARLVAILDGIFSAFDSVAERLSLEKIKTIGDAYMAAGGVPLPTRDHAEAIAEMALEIRRTVSAMRASDVGVDEGFEVRIGVHTGPVVAGVIGRKKFIYDLWGDTVNVASRMESHGQPGRIQVTEAVYERLKHRYSFERRGVIEVKGKGSMVTYWLLGEVT
jgi:adenylate cyclase